MRQSVLALAVLLIVSLVPADPTSAQVLGFTVENKDFMNTEDGRLIGQYNRDIRSLKENSLRYKEGSVSYRALVEKAAKLKKERKKVVERFKRRYGGVVGREMFISGDGVSRSEAVAFVVAHVEAGRSPPPVVWRNPQTGRLEGGTNPPTTRSTRTTGSTGSTGTGTTSGGGTYSGGGSNIPTSQVHKCAAILGMGDDTYCQE